MQDTSFFSPKYGSSKKLKGFTVKCRQGNLKWQRTEIWRKSDNVGILNRWKNFQVFLIWLKKWI